MNFMCRRSRNNFKFCRMRYHRVMEGICAEDDESLLLISDGQRASKEQRSLILKIASGVVGIPAFMPPLIKGLKILRIATDNVFEIFVFFDVYRIKEESVRFV